MEPVDPVEDFLCTRGTIEQGTTTLEVYRSTTDTWDDPITVRGSHGIEFTQGGHNGDIVTTHTDWWITAITSTAPQLDRPTLNSKITACGKVWLILDVSPNPRNGRLFDCQTQLSPGG